MDTSETRIKMCEKAEEIQTGWVKSKGDYAFMSVLDRVGIVGLDDDWPSNGHSTGGTLATRYIWLPHQDQLQKMVDYSDIHSLVMHFWEFIGYDHICTSMEQLWLAFVMKEKYNKVWNGEDWE